MGSRTRSHNVFQDVANYCCKTLLARQEGPIATKGLYKGVGIAYFSGVFGVPLDGASQYGIASLCSSLCVCVPVCPSPPPLTSTVLCNLIAESPHMKPTPCTCIRTASSNCSTYTRKNYPLKAPETFRTLPAVMDICTFRAMAVHTHLPDDQSKAKTTVKVGSWSTVNPPSRRSDNRTLFFQTPQEVAFEEPVQR